MVVTARQACVAYSDEHLIRFLEAFRGKNLVDKVVRKLCSREKYVEYLKRQYTDYQVLRMISGVEFEEFREYVIKGLWNIIHNRYPRQP